MKACQTAGERSPAGRPAPGPRARPPPSPRGAPGPARPAAARLPPPPRRAPRRALHAPGQSVPLSQQSMALYGETSLRPAELHHPCPMLPHAEHAQPSRSRSVACIVRRTGSGVAAKCCNAKCSTCTAGRAPAWRAPRARAPAPRQSAARLLPPPHRAPRCVRATPGRTASFSRACVYELVKRLHSCRHTDDV